MNRIRIIQVSVIVLACATLAARCDNSGGNSGGSSGSGGSGGSGSALCKPLETPCQGGELLVKSSYSLCCKGFWHVVEDDTYSCPPMGATTTFRVADDPTTQPCTQPGGDAGTPIPGCMASCPAVPGCTRLAPLDPNACTNATCTAPLPQCNYQCDDGGTATATGRCIPPN